MGPSANTPSGSVDPSWPLCPPSNRCGSPSRSTTNPPWNRPPQVLLNYLLNYLEDIGSTPLSLSSFFLSLILLLLSCSFNSFISHLIYLLSFSTSEKGLKIVFFFPLPSFEFS